MRWQKAADGISRVQVSPELIGVGHGRRRVAAAVRCPAHRRVPDAGRHRGPGGAGADLAIGSRQQQALDHHPTQNLTAYDAFLKGKAQRALGRDPVTLRRAVSFFEQAVALDSTFVAAWAALSESASAFLAIGALWERAADRAHVAAERAIALDPKHPDGYRALGDYYLVARNPARAAESYSKGLALAPDDADLLRGLRLVEQSAGRWEQAVVQLRRSLSLDPRSAITADELGSTLLWLRRYDEALQAVDQALAVEPASLPAVQHKAMVFLGRGDLEGARALLAEPPAGVDLPAFVVFMSTVWDLYWPLSAEQRSLVKRLPPSAFDGDAGAWGLALAGVYEVEGDMRRAAAYGDSAATALEQQLAASPGDAHRMVLLGVALAYQGRKAEALRLGRQGVELLPGNYFLHQLARIYILTGDAEKAMDTLERLLASPYYLSPGWLRIDPAFDPIRKHPRFQKLVAMHPRVAAPMQIHRRLRYAASGATAVAAFLGPFPAWAQQREMTEGETIPFKLSYVGHKFVESTEEDCPDMRPNGEEVLTAQLRLVDAEAGVSYRYEGTGRFSADIDGCGLTPNREDPGEVYDRGDVPGDFHGDNFLGCKVTTVLPEHAVRVQVEVDMVDPRRPNYVEVEWEAVAPAPRTKVSTGCEPAYHADYVKQMADDVPARGRTGRSPTTIFSRGWRRGASCAWASTGRRIKRA